MGPVITSKVELAAADLLQTVVAFPQYSFLLCCCCGEAEEGIAESVLANLSHEQQQQQQLLWTRGRYA